MRLIQSQPWPSVERTLQVPAPALRRYMINVATTIGGHQRHIAGPDGSNSGLLTAPIEITPNAVGRKHNKRSHSSVRVERRFGVRVSAGYCCKRKQRGAVASIRA